MKNLRVKIAIAVVLLALAFDLYVLIYSSNVVNKLAGAGGFIYILWPIRAIIRHYLG